MATLDFREVPGFSSLILDYVHNFGRLSSYYARNPRLDGEYTTLAGPCGDRDYRRADLRAMLLAQQAAWGAPARLGSGSTNSAAPMVWPCAPGSRRVSSAAPCSPCTRP